MTFYFKQKGRIQTRMRQSICNVMQGKARQGKARQGNVMCRVFHDILQTIYTFTISTDLTIKTRKLPFDS